MPTARTKNLVARLYRTPFNLCQTKAMPHGEWRVGVQIRTGLGSGQVRTPDRVGGDRSTRRAEKRLQCKEGSDLMRSVIFVKSYYEVFAPEVSLIV